ncbi:N-acyltransferase protein [Rhizobium phage RHph_X2_26]|nr:N-acyltransferase protein [Rhizobium phage RHph_X2_26]
MLQHAEREDFPHYFRLVKQFHAEGLFPFALDAARQKAIFDVALGDPQTALWLWRVDGIPQGYLLARLGIAPMSGEYVAQEQMLFVARDFRDGGEAFLALMSAFVDWAEDAAVDRITVSTQETMRPRALGRAFERLGFVKAETHYIRRS